MCSEYFEKLKDPRWQKKRLEVLNRDKWACKICGDKKSNLQVHHLVYKNTPWESEFKDLVTLCKDCHEDQTYLYQELQPLLRRYLMYDGFWDCAMELIHYANKGCDLDSLTLLIDKKWRAET